jgi:hypothetical protein
MFDRDVPLKILSTGVATITKNGRIHTFVQGNLTWEDFIEKTKKAVKELK